MDVQFSEVIRIYHRGEEVDVPCPLEATAKQVADNSKGLITEDQAAMLLSVRDDMILSQYEVSLTFKNKGVDIKFVAA